MPQRLFGKRRTVRTTRKLEEKKPTLQRLQKGQRIKITAGTLSGKTTEILKITKDGVIVSVAEPITVLGKSGYWGKTVDVERHPTKHRIEMIRYGSFKLQPHSQLQIQVRGMPLKQRKIVLDKLKELNQLKQKKEKSKDDFKRIKQLQKDLSYV